MKVIIVDNQTFAIHTDDQEITTEIYPQASDILLTDEIENVLGIIEEPEEIDLETGEVITPATPGTPPMTKTEVLALMTDEQKAASDLYFVEVTQKNLSAATVEGHINPPILLDGMVAQINAKAAEYSTTTAEILKVLQ